MRFEELAKYAIDLSGYTIIWIGYQDEQEAAILQIQKSGLEFTRVNYVKSNGDGVMDWIESPDGDAILTYMAGNKPEPVSTSYGRNWYQTRGYVIWNPDIVPFYIGYDRSKFYKISMTDQ
jgi:hypothetical protein